MPTSGHRVKIIENEKRNKRTEKKWNMMVTVIPIVIGMFRMIS